MHLIKRPKTISKKTYDAAAHVVRGGGRGRTSPCLAGIPALGKLSPKNEDIQLLAIVEKAAATGTQWLFGCGSIAFTTEGTAVQIVHADRQVDANILRVGLVGTVIYRTGDTLQIALSVSADAGNGLAGKVGDAGGGMTVLVDDEVELGPVVGLAGPGFQGLATRGSKVGGGHDFEGLVPPGGVGVACLELGGFVGHARGDVEFSLALAVRVARCVSVDGEGTRRALGVDGREEDGEGCKGAFHLGCSSFK